MFVSKSINFIFNRNFIFDRLKPFGDYSREYYFVSGGDFRNL